MWEQVGEWEMVIPLFPVITVEGRIVWLRKCQRRWLERRYKDGYDHLRARERHTQYRVWPIDASTWGRMGK